MLQKRECIPFLGGKHSLLSRFSTYRLCNMQSMRHHDSPMAKTIINETIDGENYLTWSFLYCDGVTPYSSWKYLEK